MQDPPITFTNEDYEGTIPHSDDPMPTIWWNKYMDQGSSADMIFWPTFKKLGFSELSLEECLGTLISFVGEQVKIQGVINLKTILEIELGIRVVKMRFIVVNALTLYNDMLGQPTLN
ncbi:hypothetical protein CR513_33601, partial [Mucuna pruriens]